MPDQRQSRALVVSLILFWLGCLIGFVGVLLPQSPLLAMAALVALPFGFRFYFVLYQVWEGDTGVSAWRMMFDPTVVRARLDVTRRMLDLFRPTWIRHTLRETGWSTRFVGSVLAGLLFIDLSLFVVAVVAAPSK